MKFLKKTDPQIYSLVKAEEKRLEETLMMIPSENLASEAVEEAVGSSFGNKYAEGYPYKRYYQGQLFIDQVETLVGDRIKKLFKVPYANPQPYSGSPANFAIYTALLNPGDKIMGLDLSHGGHLTHGAKASAVSKFFHSIPYYLNKEGYIDYDELEKSALKEKPKIIVAGTTAYPRFLDWKRFAQIAQKVDAYLMADISHITGLILGGVYPTPVPYVHVIMTTTHKTLRGPRGAIIMVTDKGLKKDPQMADKISKAVFPGLQGGPHINTIAGIGVALKEASRTSFKKYASSVVKNAKTLAQELVKYNFNLVSGGTDSHLILIDLQNKKLLGNTVAEACEAAGIVLNRNSVPYDPNPPFFPSGIRLGTPGITSRGMKEKEMKLIANWINQVVEGLSETKKRQAIGTDKEKKRDTRNQLIQKTAIIKQVGKQVKLLCRRFPIKKAY